MHAEKVLDRGEKIEVLVDQTDRLQTKSYGFQSKAKSLKRYARGRGGKSTTGANTENTHRRNLILKNIKLTICIGICCLVCKLATSPTALVDLCLLFIRY